MIRYLVASTLVAPVVTIATEIIPQGAANTTANVWTAVATTFCGILLSRLLNRFDKLELDVRALDEDVRLLASHHPEIKFRSRGK